jgi:hypothetical protein
MPFRMFGSGTFEHTHERKMMDQIRRSLQEIYIKSNNWCALFIDLNVDGKQIDGFILKKDKLILIEMKNFHGKIIADLSDESKWKIYSNDSEMYEPERNPFSQVKNNRDNLISSLSQIRKNYRNKVQRTFVSGWVIVPDDSESEIKNTSWNIEKWFNIIKLKDTAIETTFQTSQKKLHIDEKTIKILAESLEVVEF